MFYPSYQAEDGKWYFDNGEYHFITNWVLIIKIVYNYDILIFF